VTYLLDANVLIPARTGSPAGVKRRNDTDIAERVYTLRPSGRMADCTRSPVSQIVGLCPPLPVQAVRWGTR